MHENEVMDLLSPSLSWFNKLGSHLSNIFIQPANELSLHWSRFDNIRRGEDRGTVSFGNWQLFETQAREKIILQYPTTYSINILVY